MPDSFEPIELFIRNARQVSAAVGRFASAAEAISSAVDRCSLKEACTLLPSGCEADLSDKARDLCDAKPGRHIVAAPGLKGNEKKQVGETTNMLDIVTAMQLADKVISL